MAGLLKFPCPAVAAIALQVLLLGGTSGGSDSRPALRETRTERLQIPILSLDVAPGSELAAVALSNGRVRVWRLDTGKTEYEFGFTEPETDQRQKDEDEVEPIRIRFAPDGRTLGVSYLSRVHLYEVGTWSELKSIGIEGEDVMRPLPRPQLTSRPAVERVPADINTGTREWVQRKTLGDGRTRITDFAFTTDGEGMAVSYCRESCYDRPSSFAFRFAGGRDPVRLWEVRTGRMLWEHYSKLNQIPERVAPSPDGKLLVEVVGHGVELMELATGRELRSIVFPPHLSPHEPYDVAFMLDGRGFVTLWSEPHKMWQMALFDTTSGQIVAHFIDRAGAQRAAVSNNGLWLAITTWRGAAFKLWDLEKRKPVLTVKPRASGVEVRSLDVRFASDDRRVVVCDKSNGLVFTYELTVGRSRPRAGNMG